MNNCDWFLKFVSSVGGSRCDHAPRAPLRVISNLGSVDWGSQRVEDSVMPAAGRHGNKKA
jgi:hypothetical protein